MKQFLIFILLLLSTTTFSADSVSVKAGTDTVVVIAKDKAQAADTITDPIRGTLSRNLDKLGAPNVEPILTPSEIIWSVIFILFGFVFLRIFSGIFNRIAERSAKYRISLKRFIPIFKIVVWILLIFTIIQGIIQPPLATVLAFFTSIGVAVGFAAQDLLKNVFGGLMILFDRPFQIGDKIEVAGNYGEVIKIGLRSTRIVTADDSAVSVPNAEMMNSAISNSNSGESNCQVVAEIYLPLDTNTQLARKIAIETAQVSKYIYLKKPIAVVFVNEFKDKQSVLKMRIKAYVFDIRNEFTFKSDMTEIVLRELVAQGLLKPDSFK